MKSLVRLTSLLVIFAASSLLAVEPITAFRTGNELIVDIHRVDSLRHQHKDLSAELLLSQNGKDRKLVIDLEDPAIQRALVIDLAQFDRCDSLTVLVKSGDSRVVAKQVVAPIPEVPIQFNSSIAAGTASYIEAGTAMSKALSVPNSGGETKLAVPRILLPNLQQVRQVTLTEPSRVVARQEITYPVVTDVDFIGVGGGIVGRQTAAPDDLSKVSVYFSGKKAIYDGIHLKRWQKFLVEIPINNSWRTGNGDESLRLLPEQYAVHMTNEKTPKGINILNHKEGDLGQLGETDTDDQGRIYWRIDGGGGAFVVRFDPRTKRFEQPPTQIDFHKLVPPGTGMLNEGLCKVSCTHGRVFFTMCHDTLYSGDPKNLLNRRIGGVFSISQDWSDAAAFEKDMRLHVGSWHTASPSFYAGPPKADVTARKLGECSVTETGLYITTAESKYEGGPWRLDLDEKGNTKFFGTVKSLDDPVATNGTRLPPTKLVTLRGQLKSKSHHVGPGANNLIGIKFGEVTLPRASVRLLAQGYDGLNMIKVSKHVSTYEGAPPGVLTLKFDLVEKLRSHPEAQGEFAASLNGGSSLGPAFLLSPIPGEASRAVAVCEYSHYPFSILDFSHVKDRKTVTKRFLPPHAPASPRVGPYNSTWVRHNDELWLYVTGYTGMSRTLYSKNGKQVPNVAAELFHARLAPVPIDLAHRTSMKKVDGLLHVFGGRLLDSGYGLGGRGGDAYSTGVELFDASYLDANQSSKVPSQTSAHMSRCFALKTLQSRIVWNANDGSRRQEVFAASGSVRQQLVNELADPSIGPKNLDAKIFCYDITEQAGLRDLFGFSLPRATSAQATEGHIVLSPCNRFLIILTHDGVLYSYGIADRRFVDAARLQNPAGSSVEMIEFKRPSEIIFTSPDGQIFFLTEPFDKTRPSLNFNRVAVGNDGRLTVEPHLAIKFDAGEDFSDFKGIVRCFLPDRDNNDGSCDLVLGYGQQNIQPFVRVITDFVAPKAAP